MKEILMERTKTSPEVSYESESNTLTLLGKSFPEDTMKIYEPIYSWIDNHMKQQNTLNVDLHLIYLNSTSTKAIYDLLKFISDHNKRGMNIVVNWLYDEENYLMEEMGEDYQEAFEDLSFIMKMIEEES